MIQRRGQIQERLPFIGALGFGFIAALPWLIQYSYSRGYDLFLWIYNAWYFKRAVANFTIPNWSYFAAAGQPFFKIGGLSDCVVLALLSWIFGTFGGIKAFVALFYLIAAAGCFVLGRQVTRDPIAAVVCAAAYVLSWFLTITVYFQGYLSNFMSYALLPWFVYLYYRAVYNTRLEYAVGAGIVLFLSITSNPQVAIKVFGFGAVWVVLTGWKRNAFGWDFFKYSGTIGIVGLWLSFFNITSALALRSEVIKITERTNALHSPLELFLIPLYGLNLAFYHLLDLQLFEIPLRDLRFSGYPGLSVLALAAVSWRWFKNRQDRFVSTLWAMAGGLYLLYWVIFGLVPASSWVGISHNLLIYPTLCLALLSGFRTLQIRNWAVRRYGASGARWSMVLIFSMIIADLGGVNYCLNRFGVTRTPLAELPEARAWKASADELRASGTESRFYSFNPDHTIYLFPVLMGKPTANVIDLRQRRPEYQSYLTFLMNLAQKSEEGAYPSALLSMLNVKFIDVPAKTYTYRGAAKVDGPYEAYLHGLHLFDQDPDLQRIYQRMEESEDLGWARQATSPEAILRKEHTASRLAQVIYVNNRTYPAFIPDHVVAIVGNTLEGERKFEEIARSALFSPTKVGFLLVESLEVMDEREKAPLTGYYSDLTASMNNYQFLSLPSIRALYEQISAEEDKVQIRRVNEEFVEVLVEPAAVDRYTFFSQQYFKGWHARKEGGESLPVYMAGAGLTAVFLPAGTQKFSLMYKLPWYEKWARVFSLTGGFCLAVLISRQIFKKKGYPTG